MLKIKEESEKVGLKLNVQKTKIMSSGPITSWQIDGETVETVADFRGRDTGSALALTVYTLLCGGPLTCTADPSRPAEDWWLQNHYRW